MSLAELPPYAPPSPSPDYSIEPVCGERTLEHTPRSSPPTPESTFIKEAGKATVILHNQEAGVTIPSYGRGATVAGSVLFDSPDNISTVVLHVCGKLETISTDGGPRVIHLIDNKRVLWSDAAKNGQHPSQISFSVRLPTTFNDNGETRSLPPSYMADFQTVPAMLVRSSYSLQVLVTRIPSRKVGFFTRTKRIYIPFLYYPRTRPHRPVLDSPCFFAGIKSTPEEWFQSMLPMQTSTSGQSDPIHAQLFVPSSRIYGIRDTIPFHVQLCGSEESLRAFLQPKSKDKRRYPKSGDCNKSLFDSLSSLSTSSPQKNWSDTSRAPTSRKQPPPSPPSSSASPILSPHLSTQPPFFPDTDATRPTLRVILLRQVAIESYPGKKSWRNQIIGETRPVPVPPLLSASRHSQSGVADAGEEDHLDWEGDLTIDQNFKVGGFQADKVHIKDFIALSILPEKERTSPLYGIKLTVPVKLVTDSWTDGGLPTQ